MTVLGRQRQTEIQANLVCLVYFRLVRAIY